MAPFVQWNALKVISGLLNFDASLVRNVARVAELGGASHVDIVYDEGLVHVAKSVAGSVAVCVCHQWTPEELFAAVVAGADMVELGDFDSFYDQGTTFTKEDVITPRTRELLHDTPLSVTVPHTLSLAVLLQLVRTLEQLGADIIQTEGKMAVGIVNIASRACREALHKTQRIPRNLY